MQFRRKFLHNFMQEFIQSFRRSSLVKFSRDYSRYSSRDFFRKKGFFSDFFFETLVGVPSEILNFTPYHNSIGIPLRIPAGFFFGIAPEISLENTKYVFLKGPSEVPQRFLHKLLIDVSTPDIFSTTP